MTFHHFGSAPSAFALTAASPPPPLSCRRGAFIRRRATFFLFAPFCFRFIVAIFRRAGAFKRARFAAARMLLRGGADAAQRQLALPPLPAAQAARDAGTRHAMLAMAERLIQRHAQQMF